MDEFKCAFSNTLVTNQYGCALGRPVARRGGPDVVCGTEAAHQRCEELFQKLKAVALPAFDVEDDLLAMPHSVLVKIQHGGLSGLNRLVQIETSTEEIQNIHALVDRAIDQFSSLDAIPYPELVDAMTTYKLKRRR